MTNWASIRDEIQPAIDEILERAKAHMDFEGGISWPVRPPTVTPTLRDKINRACELVHELEAGLIPDTWLMEDALSCGQHDAVYYLADRIRDTEARIAKLNTSIDYMLRACEDRLKPDDITPAMIAAAKQYPISQLIEVNRAGFAACLWHQERTPSMHLYPDNHVYCHGCHQVGDSIDVYMQLHGGSWRDAVRALC